MLMKEQRQIIDLIHSLFSASFPELEVSPSAFSHLLEWENADISTFEAEGKTAGCAVTQGNALRLLCVLPDYQKRGIGTALLRQAEQRVRDSGAKEIVIGGSGTHLFVGAPEKSKGFFDRQGYDFSGRYDEMRGDLSAFHAADFSLPVPDGVQFGWYQGDIERLREAVAKVDEDWPQYFQADSSVFCATVNGEIASFCNVDVWENCLLSNGKNKVGAPGCVGTVPEYRKKGIGLKMVALACEELKKQGCDTCFIHYTGVADWYAKLGFRVFLSWYKGKKTL